MTSVESTRTQAGMFDITLTIDAGRFKANGNGEESELPLEEYIDIGLALVHPNEIAVEEDIFHLDRYLIRAGENKVSFRVASEPRFAMLDPFIKLVDRDVEDNYLEF
jgi:ABC-2 type transport system permease protein